jgi:hypothetical protein
MGKTESDSSYAENLCRKKRLATFPIIPARCRESLASDSVVFKSSSQSIFLTHLFSFSTTGVGFLKSRKTF